MRGRRSDEGELAQFVSARTAELHRTAYLLTGDQERAERLVAAAVDRLRRDGTPLSQAGGAAGRYMARLAAAAESLGRPSDSDACRDALVYFAERASAPDAAITLAAAASVRRRLSGH